MIAASTPWPYPTLIAHRGGGRYAPENTLAALRTGAAHGYRMMEYDVKLSADEVPILLHDDTVDRCSDGRGAAADLDWKALAALDFGAWHGPAFAGEPLATLYAAARYTLANGLCSNIEIKPSPGADAHTGARVAALAARLWRGAHPPPLLSSFSETALQAAREAAPELPRALLIDGPVSPDWHARVRDLDCIGLHIDHRHAAREVVADVLGRGRALAVWTVNDAGRARELSAWGCHALFTDELDTLKPAAPARP
ncbi:glycerophosphodiester phosphodiesterase [Castellaniella sp. S9]|uniref:glycerophosphodiester phosphodiesterase n=1 Tax=Castellaniella sp. S9 TaxID=2993652 RepID=UPI0022B2AD15|nr:glycerophosphodiester phosphodiesterase [Castellaniella sp. S9]